MPFTTPSENVLILDRALALCDFLALEHRRLAVDLLDIQRALPSSCEGARIAQTIWDSLKKADELRLRIIDHRQTMDAQSQPI